MSTKIFKKLISVVMTVILLISTFVVPSFAASKAKLNYTAKQITYGKTVTLKVSGYSGKVTWSTSDKTVAAVSTKGVVKAVNLGSAKITAKAGKQTLTCKIKVVDVNTNASVSLKISDGGYFIKGVSKATAVFKPKANCAKAVATIYSSDGDKVYSKTFTSLKKKNLYSFTWSGKTSSGKYVPAGKYQLKVKIGTTVSKSAFLKFEAKNLFAGGNGSKTNPFLIEKTSQFNNVGKYPNAYFKQMNNLDFGYESAGGFFNQNNPFNGVYDGNKKTIKNAVSNDALFRYVGKNGTLKNIVVSNCKVVAYGGKTDEYGILADHNYGKIANCKVNGTITSHPDESIDGIYDISLGIIAGENNGTIANCTSSGKGTLNGIEYIGGIAGINNSRGKIYLCVSNADVTITYPSFCRYAGGICGYNGGEIIECEATGSVCCDDYAGGIAGENEGDIAECTYSGPSDVALTGESV